MAAWTFRGYRRLPLDDAPPFAALTGSTIGTFQLKVPPKGPQALGADNIEDIVASVALIRPGPIREIWWNPYCPKTERSPLLTYTRNWAILAKTYGVPSRNR